MEKRYKNIILFVSSILLANNINAVDLDGKSYPIKSLYSGNCINVEGESSEIGAKIVQYPCTEDDSQKFTFAKNSEGKYTISTPQGKKLAVASSSKSNSVNIVQLDTAGLFEIEKVESGYKLKNTNSQKYLSVETSSSDIVQYYGNSSDKQIWKIGEQYPNLVPYYETTYSITEVNQNTANQANLTSALKNMKETWANGSLMFVGAVNVKPYAILDAGENKKFKIGNLRTDYPHSNQPDTAYNNTFDILISDDGINYSLLYRSNYSYPKFYIEHKMSGEARFIKFEITDIGHSGYARIFFDTNFPFWDLSIFDDI